MILISVGTFKEGSKKCCHNIKPSGNHHIGFKLEIISKKIGWMTELYISDNYFTLVRYNMLEKERKNVTRSYLPY